MSGLPEGWCAATLDQVARWGSGGTPSRMHPEYFGGTIPWIKTGELGTRILHSTEEALSDLGLANSSAKLFPRGAVAIAMYGATIGKTSILGIDAATNQACAVAVPDSAVTTTEYLYHYLCSQREAFVEAGKGGAQPNISQGVIKAWPIPLSPLPEQKRIADKLDTLLARVDTCCNNLARVPAILKRFRQSVLAAATSGELARDWRAERNLDKAWRIGRLQEVGELGRGKSKHRPRNDPRLYGGSHPFIQTGAVAQSRGIITSHTQTYNDFGLAQSKLWPARTVCITIAANIADTAILTYPACFPDSVVGFVADPKLALPEFAKWSIDVVSAQLEAFAPATAQKNINLAILNEIHFHWPSIAEQAEIVRRVESLFALADHLEGRYTAASAHLDRLTPALLAKAFRGELVTPSRSRQTNLKLQ